MNRTIKSVGALAALLLAALLGACSTPSVLNSFSSDVGYKVSSDQPYDRELNLRLDVYTPTGPRTRAIVVFFHGGRWSHGSKDEYKFVGQALASRGFVAVIPDFRQYPQVRFPAFVKDAANAVKWARDNAGRYGADPGQLFVMGHQSGGQIAALLALDPEYLKDVGGSRSWLRGMIGLAGAYDFLPITAPDLRDLFGPVERFPYSQPIYYVDGQNPPLCLIHGRNDEEVWVSNTVNLAKAVSKAGGPVETVLYDNLSNKMIIGSLASFLRGRADVLDNIEDFIKRTIKAPVRQPGQTQIQATPLTPGAAPAATPPAGSENAAPAPPLQDMPMAQPQPLQIETLPEEDDSAGGNPTPRAGATPSSGASGAGTQAQ